MVRLAKLFNVETTRRLGVDIASSYTQEQPWLVFLVLARSVLLSFDGV